MLYDWVVVSLVDAEDGNIEELVGDGRAGVEVLHVLAAVPGDVAEEHNRLKNEVVQRPIRSIFSWFKTVNTVTTFVKILLTFIG